MLQLPLRSTRQWEAVTLRRLSGRRLQPAQATDCLRRTSARLGRTRSIQQSADADGGWGDCLPCTAPTSCSTVARHLAVARKTCACRLNPVADRAREVTLRLAIGHAPHVGRRLATFGDAPAKDETSDVRHPAACVGQQRTTSLLPQVAGMSANRQVASPSMFPVDSRFSLKMLR